ncbi:hypothetical protein MMC15_006304, partial [Xylographa vitiligo]|nr:hypothetical protein [Xylographa vitiligo]
MNHFVPSDVKDWDSSLGKADPGVARSRIADILLNNHKPAIEKIYLQLGKPANDESELSYI